MALSIRHMAGVERGTSANIGVSTSARNYWRKYYQTQNVPQMLGNNAIINELIASDYAKAKPLHRFPLRTPGEDAEIRLSHKFYYVAAIRPNGQHDVIVIQPMYKEPPEEVRQRRLTEEWLKRVRKKRK